MKSTKKRVWLSECSLDSYLMNRERILNGLKDSIKDLEQ